MPGSAHSCSGPHPLPHCKADVERLAEDLGLVELRGVRGQDVIEARRGQVERIAADVAARRDRHGEEGRAVVAQLDVVDVGTEVLRLARLGRRVQPYPRSTSTPRVGLRGTVTPWWG
jgi:hypothetical protein